MPLYNKIYSLCWGLMTGQPLWVILCLLLEKGRKEIYRSDSSGEEIEGQGRKRNRNESEETEEIKTFPPLPLPATSIAGPAQL